MKPLLVILALALGGCGGLSFNPKATMCLEPGFSDSQTEAIIAAGEEWHDKTSGEVDFQFRMGIGCEVEIQPVTHLRIDDNTALGETDGRFLWIKLNIDPGETSNYSIRETALHELGHYLTGAQHSPHREDIMFPRGRRLILKDGTVRDPRYLTENDVARWGDGNHSYYQEADHYAAE